MAEVGESALDGHNIAFLEDLYGQYLADPASIAADFRAYFDSLGRPSPGTRVGPSFTPRSLFNAASAGSSAPSNGHGRSHVAMPAAAPAVVNVPVSESQAPAGPGGLALEALASGNLRLAPVGSLRPVSATETLDIAIRQDRVDQLVRAYRVRGHMIAKIDPLEMPRAAMPELDPKFYHLADADMDRRFSSRTIYGTETLTLREILDRLRNTYCRSIGVEFMHIHDIEPKNWLQERMEGTENRLEISVAEQRRILTLLTDRKSVV